MRSPLFRPLVTSMSVAPVMPVLTGRKWTRSLPLTLLTTKTPWTSWFGWELFVAAETVEDEPVGVVVSLRCFGSRMVSA